MSLFNDTVEVLRQATAFATRRHQMLAQNVANAETPGFEARDLTFDSELGLAQRVRALPATSLDLPALPLRLVQSPDGRVSPDGNTVDIDRQMTRLAQNTLYHNVAVQLLTARFAALKTAINGRA